MYRILTAFIPVVLGVVVVGCTPSGHPTAEVTGSVKLADGKGLPAGIITFHHSDPKVRPAAGQITDGKYTVPQAPVGSCKVTITSMAPTGGSPDPKAKLEKAEIVPIPASYGDKDKTDQSFEVKSGAKNSFDVTIKN